MPQLKTDQYFDLDNLLLSSERKHEKKIQQIYMKQMSKILLDILMNCIMIVVIVLSSIIIHKISKAKNNKDTADLTKTLMKTPFWTSIMILIVALFILYFKFLSIDANNEKFFDYVTGKGQTYVLLFLLPFVFSFHSIFELNETHSDIKNLQIQDRELIKTIRNLLIGLISILLFWSVLLFTKSFILSESISTINIQNIS